tara:strand:- start:286 stop:1131 length:846 start_codon:yes stop_codon:yes gene_type:complete
MNKKINIVSFFVLIFGCTRENPIGYVSKPVSVTINISEENNDLEFIWELTSIPNNSNLKNSDIQAGDDTYSVKFTPDVIGEYSIEASVFQYNDEIETQSFSFNIIESTKIENASNSEIGDSFPDTLALAQLLSDSDSETKWFEGDDVSQYLTSLDQDSSSSSSPKLLENTIEKEDPVTPPAPKRKKKKQIKGQSIPYDSNRFTIQIASKKQLGDAKKVAATLIESGYDAYIQKAFFKESNETWFRIRVGSYDNRETATAVAQSLSKSRRETAWVDFVRYEN